MIRFFHAEYPVEVTALGARHFIMDSQFHRYSLAAYGYANQFLG